MKHIVVLERDERGPLFNALYWHLVQETMLELSPKLTKKGVENNRKLRIILEKLALSLKKKLEPIEWFAVGITKLVPEEELKKWTNPTSEYAKKDPVSHRKAFYFSSNKRFYVDKNLKTQVFLS